MSATHLPDLLRNEYGLYELTEVSRAPESTTYKASNQWGNRVVEVECANEPLGESRAGDIEGWKTAVDRLRHPAVGRIDGVGSSDGRVFVVREPAAGETLRDLVDTRLKWSNPFAEEEAARLLRPLAEAVDLFDREGCAQFLGASLTPDAVMVHRTGTEVSLRASKVGPVSRQTASPADNRNAIARLFAFMTGSPADVTTTRDVSTATGVLDALAPPAAPATIDWGIPAPLSPSPEVGRTAAPGPVQHFADTDPDLAQSQQWGDMPASTPGTAVATAAPAVEAHRTGRRGMALLVVLLLLLVAAAAVGYWWWRHNEVGKAWQGGDAALARTFPGIISRGDGARGWENLPCTSQGTDDGQKAKIRCADNDLGVSVTEYSDKGARDAALPKTDTRVVLQSGSCKVDQIELQGQNPPAYVLAPEDSLDRYALTINGGDAANKLLYLPICT